MCFFKPQRSRLEKTEMRSVRFVFLTNRPKPTWKPTFENIGVGKVGLLTDQKVFNQLLGRENRLLGRLTDFFR